MSITIPIEGMSCGNCAAAVERALRGVPGVEAVTVDHVDGSATVQGEGLDRATLADAVEDAGYLVDAAFRG